MAYRYLMIFFFLKNESNHIIISHFHVAPFSFRVLHGKVVRQTFEYNIGLGYRANADKTVHTQF